MYEAAVGIRVQSITVSQGDIFQSSRSNEQVWQHQESSVQFHLHGRLGFPWRFDRLRFARLFSLMMQKEKGRSHTRRWTMVLFSVNVCEVSKSRRGMRWNGMDEENKEGEESKEVEIKTLSECQATLGMTTHAKISLIR